MGMIDYKMNITGCDDLMDKFFDLSFATKGRALKEAVNAACTPIVKVAKKRQESVAAYWLNPSVRK